MWGGLAIRFDEPMTRVNLTAYRCTVCRAPVRKGERYCDPCADAVREMTDEYDTKYGMYEREDYLAEQTLDEPGEDGNEGGEA